MEVPLVHTADLTRLRHFAAGFLLLTASSTVVWWFVIVTDAAAQARFVPAGLPGLWLRGFIVADLVVYCGAATAAAIGLLKRSAWAWGMLCAHAGAAAYVALTCWAVSWMTDSAWWNVVLMTPEAAAAVWLSWRLRWAQRRDA